MRNLIPHCLERMIFGYKRIFTFVNRLRRYSRSHGFLFKFESEYPLVRAGARLRLAGMARPHGIAHPSHHRNCGFPAKSDEVDCARAATPP